MSESARPVLDGLIATTAGDLTRVQASFVTALHLWIGRFREAQGKIRELEAEVAAAERAQAVLARRLAAALDLLTDNQLIDLRVRLEAE